LKLLLKILTRIAHVKELAVLESIRFLVSNSTASVPPVFWFTYVFAVTLSKLINVDKWRSKEYARLEIPTTVLMRIQQRGVTFKGWVSGLRCFEKSWCLQHLSTFTASTLNKNATRSFETSEAIHRTTRHNPDYLNPNTKASSNMMYTKF
jgi:hypothetical protein